jgi:hypothetical protein
VSAAELYGACSIKRERRSRLEIGELKSAIYAELKADHPMTVRQVFYRLVVKGVIEKSEKEYQGTVIRLLTDMRMDDELSFDWIVDESRRARRTRTYDSIAEAARDTAEFYRRSALRECGDYIEIWSEKEALAGLIWEVASEYDVPVIVSKGMPSLSQVYGTFQAIRDVSQPTRNRDGKYSYIYQFGDHDPSGVLIPEVLERRLGELCERHNVCPPDISRVALSEYLITIHNLPSRPTKRDGNTHAANFVGESTELDALPASVLRDQVRRSIERHIKPQALETLRAAEESERQLLTAWASKIEEGPDTEQEQKAKLAELLAELRRREKEEDNGA